MAAFLIKEVILKYILLLSMTKFEVQRFKTSSLTNRIEFHNITHYLNL